MQKKTDLAYNANSYVLVEYRADGDDKQHSKKSSKDKDEGTGFVPLVNVVPPGFELRVARTAAVAKKK